MRRLTPFLAMLFLVTASFAGFKAKPIKPKKPELFQVRVAAAGIMIAADLLLTDKEQKDFFARPLNPSKIVPLRLAVYNNSESELQIPLAGIRLIDPNGKAIPILAAETVAEAAIEGIAVSPGTGRRIQVNPTSDSPMDRRDPSYDPSDRTDPTYDPRLDPASPEYDPLDARNRRYSDLPHVGIVYDPDRGKNAEMTKQLIAKDFLDKAHTWDPILPSTSRDRFLYFGLESRPGSARGFELRLPRGNGISQDLVLKF